MSATPPDRASPGTADAGTSEKQDRSEKRSGKPVQRKAIQSIREVFGYIRRYKGQVFVLKLDDVLLDAPLFSMLVRDIVLMHQIGVRVVLVPGAKRSIDGILKTYSVSSRDQAGVRITSERAMPLVKLGASNVTNALLSLLAENQAQGVVGNWVRARSVGVREGVDFGRTGAVDKVNVELLNRQLDQGLVPIVPNIGWNAVGKDYNLNSSELAVEVAKAMQASKLFFLGDEPGIPIVPDCGFVEPGEIETGLFSNLDAKEGQKLLSRHADALAPQHREWVALSVKALQYGVDRVHFIDGTQDGRLLQEVFSSSGFGTMFTTSEWGDIHPAHPEDIPEMLRIMQPYVERGVLVQRHAEQLGEELEQYVVYKVDDALFGCAALYPYPKHKSGEIHGVIVEPSYAGRGVGRKLVDYLVERAKKLGLTKVFLLTTQTSDFFMRLGFQEGDLGALPEERRKAFNKSRNSRIYVKKVR